MCQSDHLAALNAYNEFNFGGASRFEMCRERFLGVKTLQSIAGLKRQLLEMLSDARFVRAGLRARAVEAAGRRLDNGADGVRIALEQGVGAADGASSSGCFRCGEEGHAARDCPNSAEAAAAHAAQQAQQRRVLLGADSHQRDAVNGPLLKALLCAALYPQARQPAGAAQPTSCPLAGSRGAGYPLPCAARNPMPRAGAADGPRDLRQPERNRWPVGRIRLAALQADAGERTGGSGR